MSTYEPQTGNAAKTTAGSSAGTLKYIEGMKAAGQLYNSGGNSSGVTVSSGGSSSKTTSGGSSSGTTSTTSTASSSPVTVRSGGSSTGAADNSSADSSSTAATETAEQGKSVADYYQDYMNATNDRLKQAYEYQREQLEKARDDALREAYIKQRMTEREYPEQLAAAGINGGAAQGVLARNNADYANQRTSIYKDMAEGLADLGQSYQEGIAQTNENYLQNMAAYQQALEEMEKEFEYNKQLAKLKASLA